MKGKLGFASLAVAITLFALPVATAFAAPNDTTDSTTQWVNVDEGREAQTAAAYWVIAPIPYDSETNASAAYPDGFTVTFTILDGHTLSSEGFTVVTADGTAFDPSRYIYTEDTPGSFRFTFDQLAADERFKIEFFTDITDNALLEFPVQVVVETAEANIENSVILLARQTAGDDGGEEGEPHRLVYVGVRVYVDTNGNRTWDSDETAYTGVTTTTISGTPAVAPLITGTTGEADSPTWEYAPGDESRTITFTAPTGYTVFGQGVYSTTLDALADPTTLGAIYEVAIRPQEDQTEPPAVTPPTVEQTPVVPQQHQPPASTPERLAFTGHGGVGIYLYLAFAFLIAGLTLTVSSWQAVERRVRDEAFQN